MRENSNIFIQNKYSRNLKKLVKDSFQIHTPKFLEIEEQASAFQELEDTWKSWMMRKSKLFSCTCEHSSAWNICTYIHTTHKLNAQKSECMGFRTCEFNQNKYSSRFWRATDTSVKDTCMIPAPHTCFMLQSKPQTAPSDTWKSLTESSCNAWSLGGAAATPDNIDGPLQQSFPPSFSQHSRVVHVALHMREPHAYQNSLFQQISLANIIASLHVLTAGCAWNICIYIHIYLYIHKCVRVCLKLQMREHSNMWRSVIKTKFQRRILLFYRYMVQAAALINTVTLAKVAMRTCMYHLLSQSTHTSRRWSRCMPPSNAHWDSHRAWLNKLTACQPRSVALGAISNSTVVRCNLPRFIQLSWRNITLSYLLNFVCQARLKRLFERECPHKLQHLIAWWQKSFPFLLSSTLTPRPRCSAKRATPLLHVHRHPLFQGIILADPTTNEYRIHQQQVLGMWYRPDVPAACTGT